MKVPILEVGEAVKLMYAPNHDCSAWFVVGREGEFLLHQIIPLVPCFDLCFQIFHAFTVLKQNKFLEQD